MARPVGLVTGSFCCAIRPAADFPKAFMALEHGRSRHGLWLIPREGLVKATRMGGHRAWGSGILAGVVAGRLDQRSKPNRGSEGWRRAQPGPSSHLRCYSGHHRI